MKITESRLRNIIRNVIKESMYDSDRMSPSSMDDLLSDLNEPGCPEEMVADAVCEFFNCDRLDIDLKIDEIQGSESYRELLSFVRGFCRS